MTLRLACVVAIILAALAMGPPAATAETQGVVVIVNDQPLTERDISERITLLTVLGDAGREKLTRKAALRSLIDEQVKIAEIARFRMQATDIEIKAQLSKMAKGMDTSIEGLIARLNKQGVSETAFKRYVSTLIGFNRVFGGKYRGQITVTDADVDAKMAEIKSKASSEMARIMNDPRMKAVTVYSLMEINLPAEGDDNMLLQARAADAQQVLKRFKGCGNLRAAADGVFNVKQGKKFDADATKIPKPLRAALEKAGVGRAVGPMRGKGGIQLLAFCGTRKLTPPKPDFKMPTREQVERGLRNEKYDGLEEKYLQTIRGNVYVEYRNSSYVQQ